MDLGSIIGFVIGTIFILMGMGKNVGAFFDVPSVIIVVGGTVAATMINFPLPQLKELLKALKFAFVTKKVDAGEVITTLISFSEKARREGLLALEDDAHQLDDDFLKKGIQLIVDGTDPELVRSVLETELSFIQERHSSGSTVLKGMGTLAPAFGMIGTLIGLVLMLKDLSDPSSIGPSMAVALITTFYGSVLANLIFNPLAGKLEARSAEEVNLKAIMIEGILSIQSGDNPRIVEEKLKAFLAPVKRNVLSKNANNEAGGA